MAVISNIDGTTAEDMILDAAGPNAHKLVAVADGVEVRNAAGALSKILGSNTEPYKTSALRIQLNNLPASTSTGTQFFGPNIPADRLVLGGLIYLNQSVNAGASGISSVQVAFGVGGGGRSDNVQVCADLELIGTPGPYPRYLHGYTTPNGFLTGLGAVGVQSQGFYSLSAVGNNLDQLSSFDITLLMVFADFVLPVP
jgi:hypothetical protein